MRYFSLALAALLLTSCNDGLGVGAGGTFTVAVSGENYKVRIDNALLATKARRMLSGAEKAQIITGTLARGDGGFNTGYRWHVRPETIAFADVTIELCDGRPSDIEKNLDYWVDTVKQYCPWGGRFVREEPRF